MKQEATAGTQLARLFDFPRLDLGCWPTPVERVELPGRAGLLVKRDDLSGHGRGGVKTRKIENLIGYMLAHGYDELVTVVANVTNLVHDIAPVLRDHGLGWKIYIVNDPPLRLDERERSFGELSSAVDFVGPGHLSVAGRLLGHTLLRRARGGRPFLALPSLMHPAGVVGNARGFVEMIQQVEELGLPVPSTIYITVASGTTYAGFLLAEHLLCEEGYPPIRIRGVQVYPGAARWWILGLLRWTERALGLASAVPSARIELSPSFSHQGFGRYPAEVAERCRTLAAETGLHIDPIFGGKTWTVMEQELDSRPTESERPVLYWHCGYTPNWQELDQLVNRPGRAS